MAYRLQADDESLRAQLLMYEGDMEKTRHGVSRPFQEAFKQAERMRAMITEELALRARERSAATPTK